MRLTSVLQSSCTGWWYQQPKGPPHPPTYPVICQASNRFVKQQLAFAFYATLRRCHGPVIAADLPQPAAVPRDPRRVGCAAFHPRSHYCGTLLGCVSPESRKLRRDGPKRVLLHSATQLTLSVYSYPAFPLVLTNIRSCFTHACIQAWMAPRAVRCCPTAPPNPLQAKPSTSWPSALLQHTSGARAATE